MRRDSLTRWLGAVGVLGAIVFWAALAVLHDLRPDLSVLDDYVSDYANGSGGTLFTLAVLAHGAGNVAIAAGLRRDLGRGRVAGLGVLAFAVAAVGSFWPASSPRTRRVRRRRSRAGCIAVR